MKKLFAVMCILASSGIGFAQGVTTGSLEGVVNDPTGVPLPGATVQAELLTTGTQYRTTTDGSGRFKIVNARVGGPYLVEVVVPGMRTTMVDNVFVSLGESTRLEVQMQLEAVEAELVVVGRSTGLISPSRVGAASNVGVEALESLPTIGRGFEDFARTNPLINVQSGDEGDSPSVISVAGRNNRYNNVQIDGAVNNDLFGLADSGTPGGQSETTTISLDSIQELQLVIAPFDVRQGGFSGGGINAITRSGTNKLKGSVYSYYRNDSMFGDGPDYFPEFGEYEDLNFGFRLGGPIVQDKAFYFVNADISRRDQPTGWSIDGSTGRAFADGTLVAEADRFRDLMAAYGHDVGSSSEFTRQVNSDKIFARIDFNVSNNHNLTVRHNWIDAENLRLYPNDDLYAFPGYAHNFTNVTNSTVFQLDSIFGDDKFNQARVTYQTIKDRRAPADIFPGVQIMELGEDGDYRFYTGTDRYSGKNSLDQTIIEITDDFTFFIGDHEMTLGTHNEIFSFRNLFLQNAYGTYRFYTLDDLEAGTAYQYYYMESADDDPYDEFDAYQLGFYAGDKWRVSDNFNIIFGLRVDIPKFPDNPNYNPTFDEEFGYRTDVVPDGNALWSPRLGFNWDVTGEGTHQVRGGVGVFSGRSPYVWISNAYANTGLERNLVSAYGDIPFESDPFNQPPDTDSATVASAEINLVDPDFEFPQITRYNLAYDYQMPLWDMVASFEGVYADSQSEILYQDLNLLQDGYAFDGRPYYTRVNFDYDGVYYLTNTKGGEQTNLSVKLEKPYREGFWGYVSYAWGDSNVVNEGTSSTAYSNFNYMESADPNNMVESRSDYEVKHRFNAAVSYTFNRSSDWSTKVAMFYNHQSGRPFTVLMRSASFDSINGDNNQFNDLMYVPASEDEVVIQGGTWADLDAFISRAGLDKYRGEIAPRNSGDNPWRHELDLKISQNVPVPLGRLEATLVIANLTNLFDSDSGHRTYVNYGTVDAVRYAGIQEDTGKPIYQLLPEVRDPENNPLFEIDLLRSRWRAKLGLRWTF